MRFLITIILLSFSLTVSNFSQENEYSILTKSGEVYLLHKISKDQLEVSVGDKLKSHESIKLNPKGYVVLVDTNLRTIELTKEGIYNIAGIDTVFNMKKNSVTEKITRFILDEMSTSIEKTNEMKTLGAVVRKPLNKVEVAAPKLGKIIDTVYTFAWHPLMDSTSYIFRLFNNEGNTLYMEESSDTTITLNLSKINLRYDNNYFWTVFNNTLQNSEIDSVTFNLLSPNKIVLLKDQLQNIKKDMLVEDSPLNYLLIARYLQNEGLNELAIQYFEKSVQANPNIEFYWSEYINFLLEVDLTYEALKNWNISPFSKQEINEED